jgi:DNA-binding transcriptional LysR family regulator
MSSEDGPARGPEPHLRDLQAFVAVAEHLHFSHAARSLFTSQPALSKRIRGLEGLLRAELFARDRRGVRLTAAGEALLPGARATLAAWAGARDELARAAAAAGDHLVVGMSLGVERGLLPVVRQHLGRLAPHARLELRRMPWADASSGLAPGADAAVDAAFVWLPLASPTRYQWVTVAAEDRWLVMSSGHRLAGRGEVSFADLAEEPFIAVPAGAGPAREFWLGADARGGRAAPVAGEAASVEELVEALVAGTGVCLIAAGNLDAVRRPGTGAARVTDLAPSELVLAWRRGDDRPVLRHLVTATRRAVADTAVGRRARGA